jgi:tRNA threonylcarbamoyladenosine biosynthesis protein TsaE
LEIASFTAKQPSELHAAASFLAQLTGQWKVILFRGEMGAGKTTLIGELCRILGSHDETASPTFSIVNEYMSDIGSIYHFDLYRIGDEQELFDLGLEEYLHSGYLCLVEWPDKASAFSRDPHIVVEISCSEGERHLTVTSHA